MRIFQSNYGIYRYISRTIENKSLIIKPFIFNWPGQLEKTLFKEKQLLNIFKQVFVINSDETCDKDTWINVGNQAYFTKQFLTAISVFKGDILFHIQGDASFDDWNSIVKTAELYFRKYNWGIYAPNVNYTYFLSERVDIRSVSFEERSLALVSIPDSTCWFIHNDVISLFLKKNIDLSNNKFGWGIGGILCAISYEIGRPVIRDYSFCIAHPRSTGYSITEASKSSKELVNLLDTGLYNVFMQLSANREMLCLHISSNVYKMNRLAYIYRYFIRICKGLFRYSAI